MKKILFSMMIFLLLPMGVFASTQALDLNETLELMNLEKKYENYEESSDQVTLYLFMSQECNHCHELTEYLNELVSDHGSKFKLRAFECSKNADNNELHSKIVEFLELKNDEGRYKMGVPLLIIGKNTFYGFEESNKEKILTAIESEYKKKEKYDVIDALEEKKENKNPNDALYIIIPIVAVVIICFIIRLANKEK